MNIFMSKLIAAMDATTIIGIIVLALLLVALFIFPSMTNKKRQKHITELYRSVEVGDRIKTVGGIIGTVLEVNEINALESEIVIESGISGSTTTLVFDMQAVYQNLTKMAQRAAQFQAATSQQSAPSNDDIPAEDDAAESEGDNK